MSEFVWGCLLAFAFGVFAEVLIDEFLLLAAAVTLGGIGIAIVLLCVAARRRS